MLLNEIDFRDRATAICTNLGIAPDLIVQRGLSLWPEPAELVTVAVNPAGQSLQLAPAAAEAWQNLEQAAERAGLKLYIVSAWRSIERQEAIFRRKLAQGIALEQILLVNAPPGYSEHHSGCAIDIGTPGCLDLEEAFENTPAFHWLIDHAPAHGFELSFPRGNPFGYLYEPWHWRFVDSAAS